MGNKSRNKSYSSPQVVAYVLTCVWGIARATLCFKYNAKLRKALGP